MSGESKIVAGAAGFLGVPAFCVPAGIEGRPGSAGASPSVGRLGGRWSRGAPALPGCPERRGVWGAVRRPPIFLDPL